MILAPPQRATLDDLYAVEGKAELIDGRIVTYMPSGDMPSSIAFEIAILLREYARLCGIGAAFADGVGYGLSPKLPSGRESFSPDASYFVGPRQGMRFINGPPTFAVEVRSQSDYGPVAESNLAEKRYDYFQAGTRAVWDVDPVNKVIALFTFDQPDQPREFHLGEIADAEPTLPGWRVAVDQLFA